MNWYFCTSTLLLAFISIIWSRSDFPNVLIKLLFIAVTIWGLVLSLMAFGFVIHK